MPQGTALEALVSSMTLSELAHRSGKSVQQIVEWALAGTRGAAALRGTGAVRAATESNGVSRRRPAGGSKGVNTRTPSGRDAYDNSVLEALQAVDKGPVGASFLRRKVGGTPLQIRTALNRLIEAGKVDFEGRARATRYTAR